MSNRVLRVRARGEAKVPDYAAHNANITSRFIGWDHDPELGYEFKDSTSGEMKKSGGHRKKADVTVLEFAPGDMLFGEYLRHLRDGDLEPADAETARIAGIAFESPKKKKDGE